MRWDRAIYESDDKKAEEWLNVLPYKYGADGKDGWELVPVREQKQGGDGDDGDSSEESSV